MVATKQKKKLKEAEQIWDRWVSLWKASGKNVKEFCSKYGLGERSFYMWRRKLKKGENCSNEKGSGFAPAPDLFFPIELATDTPVEQEHKKEDRLFLTTPSGYRLGVGGEDVALLARLVHLLEKEQC